MAAMDLDRRKGKHVSLRRCVDLVLRRAAGNASLRQLCIFSGLNSSADAALLHRETLRAHEVKVMHAFVSEAVDFFKENDAAFIESDDWAMSIFCIKFDGTNSEYNKTAKY